MYFITEKTSETGKKFQVIKDKLKIVRDAQKALAKKYGFKSWRDEYWIFAGKMSSCGEFDKTPDSKIWKNGSAKNEYFPKKNSKKGKLIYSEIMALPVIEIQELNDCVGFDAGPFHTIGCAFCGKKHFGFIVKKEWGIDIPKDCKEVTETEYDKLFNDAKQTF